MRWKGLQFLRKLYSNNVESHGFKSIKCSPAIQKMTYFENDLQQMIKSIDFRQISKVFKENLKIT